MKRGWVVGLSAIFAVLTALGLTVFPGRTYLMSDTQIYIPLFEHLRDPSLLRQELILEGAHLSYTIYDEATLGLAGLFQTDFETVLVAQQALFRFLGYWGVFLLAWRCGCGMGAAVLVSAAVWLGAFVFGPAVITTEFEPVPRGFAVPLVAAALGALSWGRSTAAGVLLGVALLYHAPAVWPVLLILAWQRNWRPLVPVGIAGGVLFLLAKTQPGVVAAQPFFSLLSDGQRAIQQTRAPYNWITLWPPRWALQYLLTGGLALGAVWRLRAALPAGMRTMFAGIVLIGFATVPLSFLLLEQLGWALFPQVQPMRALLYSHLFCQWLGMIAAVIEVKEQRWWAAGLWAMVPLSLALRGDILLMPADQGWKQGLVLGLIVVGVALARWWPRREWAWVAALGAAWVYGEVLQARMHAPLETKPLRALAEWARTNTSVDAVFLFPDLGRRLEPGIFRARAARAVYVCWKQGGQVNYFPDYAAKWWERWTRILAPGHAPLDAGDLRRRGVEYLVYTKESPAGDLQPVFLTAGYRVYRLP